MIVNRTVRRFHKAMCGGLILLWPCAVWAAKPEAAPGFAARAAEAVGQAPLPVGQHPRLLFDSRQIGIIRPAPTHRKRRA